MTTLKIEGSIDEIGALEDGSGEGFVIRTDTGPVRLTGLDRDQLRTAAPMWGEEVSLTLRTAASAEQTAVPLGYLPMSEIEKLADKRVEGVGMLLRKNPREGSIAVYTVPPQQPSAAPESEQKPLSHKQQMAIAAGLGINQDSAALFLQALAAAGNSQSQDAVDAARYRWLRDKAIVVSWSYKDEAGNIIRCVSSEVRLNDRIDYAIAAMSKQEGGAA